MSNMIVLLTKYNYIQRHFKHLYFVLFVMMLFCLSLKQLSPILSELKQLLTLTFVKQSDVVLDDPLFSSMLLI